LYGDEPSPPLIAHFLGRILRCNLTNPRTICKSKVVPEIRHMPIAQDTKESPEMDASEACCVGRELMASVEDFATPEIELAWNTEIETRVNEIRWRRAEGIPAKHVMAEARRKLHEASRLLP